MSGASDRWGELSKLIVACALERPVRLDEICPDDVAPGPCRDLLRIMGERRRRRLAVDAAALVRDPEVVRAVGATLVPDLMDAPFMQANFGGYLAEARQVAGLDEVRKALDGGAELDRLGEIVERRRARLECAQAGGDGFVRLSDVAEREVEWYWPGRIAHGTLMVLAGDGGVGKSTLAQELGARMTRGQAPPGGAPGDPRGVVILTAEEDTSAVVRPRMRLMGADLGRVTVLDPDEAALTLPSGAERLEARCAAEGAGLLVVDTGPAFLDRGLKSNTEEDIRRFYAPLRAIAERQRLVVIVLSHLNKDVSRSAQHRIMGGVAWRNAARQVLIVGAPPGADPRETGERLVAVEKNNLGTHPHAVGFTIAPAPEDPSRAVVAWGGEVEGVRVEDLVAEAPSGDERSDRDAAVEFLRAELADGPRPVAELKRAAAAAALGWATVRKAKAAAGVRADKERGRFEGEWFWTLVDAPPPEVRREESHFVGVSPISLPENPAITRLSEDEPPRSETPPGHVSLRDGNGCVEDGWREAERPVDEPEPKEIVEGGEHRGAPVAGEGS